MENYKVEVFYSNTDETYVQTFNGEFDARQSFKLSCYESLSLVLTCKLKIRIELTRLKDSFSLLVFEMNCI